MSPSSAPDCHRCGSQPTYQWARLATEEEAAAQRLEIARFQGRALSSEEIAVKYGPLRVAVTGCIDHHLGDNPNNADSGLDRRALLHDTHCSGHGDCTCPASELHTDGGPTWL